MRARWVVLIVAGLVLLSSCRRQSDELAEATPVPTATPCALDGAGEATVVDDRAVTDVPLLTEVRFDPEGCPRVVFVFENELAPYSIGYDEPPFAECGSGEGISTGAWGASGYIVFHSDTASGVDLSGETFRETYTGDEDIEVSAPILRRIRRTCDFEATLEWVIALDERRPFKVSTLTGPPRIVIDVAAGGSGE